MKEHKDEIIRPAIPTPNKSDNVASREMEGKAPIVPHPPPLSSNLGKKFRKVIFAIWKQKAKTEAKYQAK